MSELLRPKPKIENAKPAGLGDFQFPTTTKDRVVPIVFGTVRIKGPNVVWYGDLRREAITIKVSTGLFSSSKKQTTGYRYSVGVQMGLARGPLDSISAIWIGEDHIMTSYGVRNVRISDRGASLPGYEIGDILTLSGGVVSGTPAQVRVTKATWFGEIENFVVDDPGSYSVLPSSPHTTTGGTGSGATFTSESGILTDGDTMSIKDDWFFGGDKEGNGGIEGTMKFFAGGPTQAPSTYLSNYQIEDTKTPAYRGTAYICPDSEPFYLGNSASIKAWSFEVRRIPNGLSLTSDRDVVNGADANPANVLYEMLTNTEWGMSHAATSIDTTSFVDAANTLHAENNGFSMMLDRPMEASELRGIIEEQISGRAYFDMTTAKWKLRLARADYILADIPVISEANAIEIRDFTRGSWEDTTNVVQVKFSNRLDQYQTDFALAQDSANVQRQAGAAVVATRNAPGVMNAASAADQAWRILRTLSFPLAKAQFVMDRTFWNTNPVDVFAFTSTQFGLTKLPMRVTRVDLGSLEDNKVILDVIQDVFFFQVASFGSSGGSGWTPPKDILLPFLADEQLAFEAPRGLALRTERALPEALVFAAARRRGNESGYAITARSSSATPSGTLSELGDAVGFMLVGELSATLASGQASPTTAITVTNAVDTQSKIIDSFFFAQGELDQGTNLINLIYVTDGTNDGEFMLVESASANGVSNVDLDKVWRGVLDTAQQGFSAGDKVYLVFAGANTAETPVIEDDNVHVRLVPQSTSYSVPSADVTQIEFTMDKRARRPYCPSEITMGTAWPSTVLLETVGGGLDSVKFVVDFIRRDYRTTDEIVPLTVDAATIDPTFPAANSTIHDMEIRNDPAGTNTLLLTTSGIAGATADVNRTALLHAAGGTLPTRLRAVLTAKHADGPDAALTSRQSLSHDFDLTSSLIGQFEFGDLDGTPTTSATYTTTTAGVYSFTIGTAFPTSGNVEVSINAGAWSTLIAQGATTGSTSALSISDTMRIRHDSTDSGAVTHIQMTPPGGGSFAWGILYV